MALLHACAVPKPSWEDWVRAWKKVRAQDRTEPAIAWKLAAREAEAELAHYELEPLEPFRSPTAAWSVRCCICLDLFRVRLADLGAGWAGCPNRCPRALVRSAAQAQLMQLDPQSCPRCESLISKEPHALSQEGCSVCRGARLPDRPPAPKP